MLQLLSDDDVVRIEKMNLRLLAEVGVRLDSEGIGLPSRNWELSLLV